jgi:hypothetical protein
LLNDLSIQLNHVYSITIDNESKCSLAVKNLKNTFNPKILEMRWCSHVVSLILQTIAKGDYFRQVNELLAEIQALFSHSPEKEQRFYEFTKLLEGNSFKLEKAILTQLGLMVQCC